MLSLDPLEDNEDESQQRLLLRLEHTFQPGEHRELSKPIRLDVKNLFSAFEIIGMRETELSGNRPIEEASGADSGYTTRLENQSRAQRLALTLTF